MTAKPPTMEPRELKDGSGWYERVTWPTGVPEDIDFSTEIEAVEWIRDKSSAWVAKRAAGV